MGSREDRLAKIMSMASGRVVDPKEVHVDRVPSPSFSECAAAGIGDLNASPSVSTITSSNGQAETKSMPKAHSPCLTSRFGCMRHLVSVLLTVILFCVWYHFVILKKADSFLLLAFCEPWQLLFGLFCAVEALEWSSGQLGRPLDILRDAALYLFILILFLKLVV